MSGSAISSLPLSRCFGDHSGCHSRPWVPHLPGVGRQWCINTAAVDAFTQSVIADSEDGKLSRRDLTANERSKVIKPSGGIGEAYAPTLIGSGRQVYGTNDSVLSAIGN
jgi:hypothetical protein